jgi:hypothetical protein
VFVLRIPSPQCNIKMPSHCKWSDYNYTKNINWNETWLCVIRLYLCKKCKLERDMTLCGDNWLYEEASLYYVFLAHSVTLKCPVIANYKIICKHVSCAAQVPILLMKSHQLKFVIWNRHDHECPRIWKLSDNFTLIQCNKVSRIFGPRYIGDDFFLVPNLVLSFYLYWYFFWFIKSLLTYWHEFLFLRGS